MAARRCRISEQALTIALLLALLAGSAAAEPQPGPLKIPDGALEPVKWTDLHGWGADDHAAAFATFRASCAPLLKRTRPTREARPVFPAALDQVCRRAAALKSTDSASAKTFFEENFRPARITKLGDQQGFLTGYYEPIVEGSRFPTRQFTVPMYRRPDDLVASAERKGDSFPNKGPVGRKTRDGTVVPYFDRGEIEEGALDGRHLEICWLKDPIAAFSIHIQGSARVRLEDGLVLRLNYAAHNGHPYTPIGRIL